jgi:hypothetical protein
VSSVEAVQDMVRVVWVMLEEERLVGTLGGVTSSGAEVVMTKAVLWAEVFPAAS